MPCIAQLSTPSTGPSALDTSQRAADTGRDDRQRHDAVAAAHGQTPGNYKVTQHAHMCNCSTLQHGFTTSSN